MDFKKRNNAFLAGIISAPLFSMILDLFIDLVTNKYVSQHPPLWFKFLWFSPLAFLAWWYWKRSE